MRKRDASAAVVAYVAVHLAGRMGSSLRATVKLSFYTGYASHNHRFDTVVEMGRPLPVDMDGDGVEDTLLVPFAPTGTVTGGIEGGGARLNGTTARSDSGGGGSGFRALDLSPLLRKQSTFSFGGTGTDSLPLFPAVSAKYQQFPLYNRTSTNEAGIASSSLYHVSPPVPIKLAAGYVDITHHNDPPSTLYVAAVWDDGSVTLHTAPSLELLWRVEGLFRQTLQVDSFGNSADDNRRKSLMLEFTEVASLLTPALGDHGAVIVGGRFIWKEVGTGQAGWKQGASHFLHYALDALNGDVIWRHDGSPRPRKDEGGNHPTNVADPKRKHHVGMHRSDPRKNIAALRELSSYLPESEDCFLHFRASVFESRAFPHFWAKRDDTSLDLAHFDRRRRGSGDISTAGSVGKNPLKNGSNQRQQKEWGVGQHDKHQKEFSHAPSRGHHSVYELVNDANVVLSQGREGIEVLSLKNGRPVCHLSLPEKRMYADINHDGVLDTVRVVMDFEGSDSGGERAFGIDYDEQEDRWIREMLNVDAMDMSAKTNRGGAMEDYISALSPPCHAMAMSGVPPMERLFEGPLCNRQGVGDIFQRGHARKNNAAPPILLEGTSLGPGYGMSLSDRVSSVVFAVNSGVVSRYSSDGGLHWQAGVSYSAAGAKGAIPIWQNKGGSSPALVGLIDVSVRAAKKNKRHPDSRPIIVSGEDDFVILCPASGSVLASSGRFPQTAVAPPILVDVNGDGTTDVLVISTDGIWAYAVSVHSRSTTIPFILLGLVFTVVAVAAMLNRIGRPPHRRSTDM